MLLTHWLSVPAYFLNYLDSFKLHILSTLRICCWNLNVSSFMSWLTFKNSQLYIIKVRDEEQTRAYLYRCVSYHWPNPHPFFELHIQKEENVESPSSLPALTSTHSGWSLIHQPGCQQRCLWEGRHSILFRINHVKWKGQLLAPGWAKRRN